jgi:hypothetical protein
MLDFASAFGLAMEGGPEIATSLVEGAAEQRWTWGDGYNGSMLVLRDGEFERVAAYGHGTLFSSPDEAADALTDALFTLEPGRADYAVKQGGTDAVEARLTWATLDWDEGGPYRVWTGHGFTFWSATRSPLEPEWMAANELERAAQDLVDCVAHANGLPTEVVAGNVVYDGQRAAYKAEAMLGEPCQGGRMFTVRLDAAQGGFIRETLAKAEQTCENQQIVY